MVFKFDRFVNTLFIFDQNVAEHLRSKWMCFVIVKVFWLLYLELIHFEEVGTVVLVGFSLGLKIEVFKLGPVINCRNTQECVWLQIKVLQILVILK